MLSESILIKALSGGQNMQSKKWWVISLAQAYFLKCIAKIVNKRSPFSS